VVRAQGIDGDQEDAAGRMEAGDGSFFAFVPAMAGSERYESEPNGAWNQPTSET